MLYLSLKQLKQLLREVKFYNITSMQKILEKYMTKLVKEEVPKCHVVIVDGDRYYVSTAVELFLSNGFTVDGYTGTASSNSKWVSVLLRGDRKKLIANAPAVTRLRELLVSGHLVTEFFAQMDEREKKRGMRDRDISLSRLSQLTVGDNDGRDNDGRDGAEVELDNEPVGDVDAEVERHDGVEEEE